MYSWVELHGATTHFPIALIFAAILFEAGALIFKKDEWRVVSFWTLVFGVIMTLPSLATGWLTGDALFGGSAHAPPLFAIHRLMGFLLTGLSGAWLLWRVVAKDRLSGTSWVVSLVLAAIATGSTLYTGFLGGQMVFGGMVSTTEAPSASAPSSKPAAPPSAVSPALLAQGEAVYRKQGCMACHQLNGQGGKTAPDLTHEGQRNSDVSWQIAHLKNPQATRPKSSMPAYKDLPPADLKALATFLAHQM